MKKVVLALSVLLVLIAVPTAGTYYYTSAYVKKWERKVYPKCTVNGIDISGQYKEGAITLLKESVKNIYDKKITVKYKDNSYILKYADLNPSHNIEQAVDEAINFGSDSDLFEKRKLIKSNYERSINLSFTYDEKPIEEFIRNLENKINKPPMDASIKISSAGKFIITNEVNGSSLDSNSLREAIKANINKDSSENVELEAKADEIRPSINAETLRKIDTLISTYSTSYRGSPAGRAANVELATKRINGKLVMPGEVFSFNESTGPRNSSTGYQTAPVIYKNKLVDGLGGGVCQVSTTLYNAAIRCNLKSLQRSNHTLAPAYTQPGFDATVADNIDYKFKNALNYPIYIEGYTKSGNVCFNIYSNSELAKIKYDLINEIYETKVPEIIYKKDPRLPKGKMEKEESPHAGYKVKVYLVGYLNGSEVSRKIISNDTYVKVDGVIRVGE